jgi:hypothetical protein
VKSPGGQPPGVFRSQQESSMRIQYLGKPGRTKTIDGKEYKFKADKEGRLVCDVTENSAIAVMLDERNKNLFRSLEQPAPLQRGNAGAGGSKKAGGKALDPVIDAATQLLSNDVGVLLDMIDTITDASLRAEMVKQENARAEGPREAVIAKLTA